LGKCRSDLISWDGISDARIYVIKIRSLQPASTEDYSLS
jgi:hypothetical protein